MEEQQWIATHFLHAYNQNKDLAYQTIIKHGVAVFSQSNVDLLRKIDGSPMDLIILNQHIITVLQNNNPVPAAPLPTPITDINPVNLTQEEEEKNNKIYIRLKDSVCLDSVDVYTEQQILHHDLIGLGDTLLALDKNLKNMLVLKTPQYFLLGKILLAMKNIDLHFMNIVKEKVQYSRSYIYFLIDFYKQCVQFPRLKQTKLPIGIISKSWRYIKDKLILDNAFWS